MTERLGYRADEAAEALGVDVETIRRALSRRKAIEVLEAGTSWDPRRD